MLVTRSIKIPDQMWKAIESLVEQGKYASVSEFMRAAIRQLLEKEGVEI